MNSFPRRPGFSLIELLVVLAIIALLIGILLPALGPAMNAGRQARCLGNLRGIGQGIEAYKNDFREVYPLARSIPSPWATILDEWPSFNEAMEDYIEPMSQAYHCPGDKVIFDYEYVDDEGIDRTTGSSYKYEPGVAGRRIEETGFMQFFKMTPSEIPVMNDYDGGSFETDDGRFVTVEFFHDKRMFLYADGSGGGSKAN